MASRVDDCIEVEGAHFERTVKKKRRVNNDVHYVNMYLLTNITVHRLSIFSIAMAHITNLYTEF